MISKTSAEICSCDSIDPSRGKGANTCTLDVQSARDLAAIFKALSDPTRLRIIATLAENELCVNDLAEALEMEQSAVSHQLSDMREKRLLAARRDGRRVYYRLNDEHVQSLFGQGLAHVRHAVDDTGCRSHG